MLVFADGSAVNTKFAEVKIDSVFEKILTSNVLLMEVTGAKVINLPKGRKAIVGVASTTIIKGSTTDLLRAEKVCKIKALANIISDRNGVQIIHIEELKDETRTVIDDAGENTTSVETLLHLTKTKVEGIVKDMPVVGRWYSPSKETYYLAIGTILDENGNVLETNE